MKEVLPGRALRMVAVCWVFSLVFCSRADPRLSMLLGVAPLHAQAAPLGAEGLDGGRFVGSARVGTRASARKSETAAAADSLRAFRGAFSLGYAHTEAVLGAGDRHERVFSELAAAWASLAWLQIALKVDGRYDQHRSTNLGSDSGFAGSSELTTRHAFAISPQFSLAGQARLRFPAANRARLGFSGITTELAGLASYAAWKGGELSGLAGYRLDRSANALSDPDALSAADRLGASVSRFDAALVGAMFTTEIERFMLLGEWSWDIFTGAGAPSPIDSPMRLRAALQTVVGERWIPGGELGVTLSSRPVFDDLIRIEPRFWAAVTIGVLLGSKRAVQKTEPLAEPLPAAPAPAVRAKGELVVLVTDDAGPLAGAAVTVTMGDEILSSEADATGRARFRVLRGESMTISVTAQGCHAATESARLSGATLEVPVALKRALPEGEIKGQVRSLRGGPLKAQVEVLTTGLVIQTNDDGTFLIDVPPGDYRLRISAEGHEPQERSAQVERLGVTILVVDLRRAHK